MGLRRFHCTVERDHLCGIDPGGMKQEEPFTVRLVLMEPAVPQHSQHAGTFDTVGQGFRKVSRHCCDQKAGGALIKHGMGGMPLENMLDFVGEHAGKLFGTVGSF